MSRPNIILLVFIFVINVMAQDSSRPSVRLQLGYDFYSMSDLKKMQSDLVDFFRPEDLQLKSTEKFPPYLSFEFQIVIPVRIINIGYGNIGGCVAYTSTGGRIHYKDYSGEVGIDQIVSRISFGGILESEIPRTTYFSQFITVKGIFALTKLEYTEFLWISGGGTSESMDFRAYSFGIEALIGNQFTINPFLLRFNLGYQFDLPSALKLKGKDAYLLDGDFNKVKANWSGIRLSLMIGIQ